MRQWDFKFYNLVVSVGMHLHTDDRIVMVPMLTALASLLWTCASAGDHYVALQHPEAELASQVSDVYSKFRWCF